VTRRLEDEKTALLAAFFIALNPSLIATSYDSPQIIGLFLSCFCVYWCLRQRYLAAGGVLAVIYLFNTFSALCISLPLAAFLVLERRWRQIPRLFAAPAVACAAWYLSRYDALYCYNSTLGPELISRVVGRWIEAYTPTILLFFVAATALVGNLRERFDRLWFVWLSAFTSLYLLNFVTPAFHPWRLDTFFFFGMSFLFASIFRKLDLRRLFFFVFFAVAGLSILYGLFTQDVFGPPFNPNEYALIERLGAMPAGMIPIANHDFCSNILALTNKTCLLDINFECIPNASRWYDYEQFFWVSRPGEMAGLLSRYPMTHVVYSSGDWGRTLLDKIEVNKIYSSWQCGIDCSRDANIYEVLRHNGSVRVLS
jgi:hypothetical protein